MDPITSIEELMTKQFPEEVWLVDKLIPSSAITIFSGPAGSYKTWALLETAIAVAKGEPLFGQFETKQSGVLIVDEESGERLLQQRLNLLHATSDLPIYFYSYKGFVLDEDSVSELALNCRVYDIKCVIFDSLVRIHNRDENSSGDMSGIFKYFRTLAAQDITVVLIHHNRKPGANKSGGSAEMRGSSDILASVDCHVALTRKDKNLIVSQTKQRYAEELEPFELLAVSEEDSFGFEFQGMIKQSGNNVQVIKDAIIKLLEENGKLYQKELQSGLTQVGAKVNEHKLRDILRAMISENLIEEIAGSGNTKFYNLTVENADE